MTWVGIGKLEKNNKKIHDLEERSKIHDEIQKHFGGKGSFTNSWTSEVFSVPILRILGFDLLYKYGYCEYCANYYGIKAFNRKNYKIPVLYSYCDIFVRPIYYNNRCENWLPKRFYRDILEIKVKDLLKERTGEDWLFKFDEGYY